MNHLATALPGLSKIRFPLSRDQVMLLIAATNEIFLGVDIYFAHLVSGTIVPREWIPILFGPIAGALLLAAGLLAQRQRLLATMLANLVFLASIVVGILGSYYHIVRAILPTAPTGERVSLDLLIWAPPVVAPLTFAGIALLGISAAWREDPPDSGILQVGRRNLQLPYSKTRAYLLMLSLGILFTLISSTLDHARERFENPWLWLPTAAGIFATVVTVALAAQEKQPSRFDVWIYLGAMLALILVGTFGLYFHINANLISEGTIVGERFLRGAPFMAPLLFCNMGMIGIAVLLKPET
jgi:hypothetical protein